MTATLRIVIGDMRYGWLRKMAGEEIQP